MTQNRQMYQQGYKDGAETYRKKLERLEEIIRARLRVCEEYNGRPDCKNCGLSEEDIESKE